MNINSQNQPVTSNILRIISVKGLKQKVVAERAGYSSQQFSDMLNGRKIIRPLDTKAIAIALEVDANELFKVDGREAEGRKRRQKMDSSIDEFKVVEEILDILEKKNVTCGEAIGISNKLAVKIMLAANKSAKKAPFSR